MRISDWSSDVCSSDLRSNQIGPPAMAGLSFFWMSMLIEIEGNEVGRRAKSTEPQHSATGSAARSWLRMVGGSSLPDRRREPSPDADLQKLSRQDRQSTRLHSSH